MTLEKKKYSLIELCVANGMYRIACIIYIVYCIRIPYTNIYTYIHYPARITSRFTLFFRLIHRKVILDTYRYLNAVKNSGRIFGK